LQAKRMLKEEKIDQGFRESDTVDKERVSVIKSLSVSEFHLG